MSASSKLFGSACQWHDVIGLIGSILIFTHHHDRFHRIIKLVARCAAEPAIHVVRRVTITRAISHMLGTATSGVRTVSRNMCQKQCDTCQSRFSFFFRNHDVDAILNDRPHYTGAQAGTHTRS